MYRGTDPRDLGARPSIRRSVEADVLVLDHANFDTAIESLLDSLNHDIVSSTCNDASYVWVFKIQGSPMFLLPQMVDVKPRIASGK